MQAYECKVSGASYGDKTSKIITRKVTRNRSLILCC